MIKNRTSGRTKSAFGAPAEPTASLTGTRQTVGQCRQAYKYAKTPRPLFGRRVRPYSPAVGNAREVRSGYRAEPSPSTRAALGRGLCLTVLRMPQTDGWCGSRPVGGRSREPSAPGNAAHARRSAPSHHGCLQLLGLDGPVGVTAAGEAPIANQGHGHAGVLGHQGGASGRFKSAAPALTSIHRLNRVAFGRVDAKGAL